jgi:hypothetical protein
MNAFSRTALKTVAGSGVIATALLAFTGMPAQATATCDVTNTIPADEAALRAALDGVGPVICIEAGTIDLSSNGVDARFGLISIGRSVSIIGIGDVVLDGAFESTIFAVPQSGSPVDLTVENLTFTRGFSPSPVEASAIFFGASGTLTILNSVFDGNSAYGAAVDVRNRDLDPSSVDQPSVVIENSTFINNVAPSRRTAQAGAVNAIGALTITNSSFVANHGDAAGAVMGAAAMDVQNNLFFDNHSNLQGGAVSSSSILGDGLISSHPVTISNNTFVSNSGLARGGALFLARDASLADNTFVDNVTLDDASNLGQSIYKESSATVGLFANIFASSTGATTLQLAGPDLRGPDNPYADFGANISTADETADDQLLLSNHVAGQVGATYASLNLGALAQNGGPTETIALNPGSIAIDAATPAIRLAATGIVQPAVDQRYVARGTASDAGAFEYVEPVIEPTLANTGLVTPSYLSLGAGSLLGGALLAGIAALTSRRRRQR